MPERSRLFRTATIVVTIAMAGLAAGCTPEISARGNIPLEETLATITVGSSTQADVAVTLGSPSSTSLFDGGETWFYIGGKQQQWAFNSSEETERRIIAIKFDRTGIIESMSVLNKEDGKEIVTVDRKTPTAGHQFTVVEQLLGNIGRFNQAPTGRPR